MMSLCDKCANMDCNHEVEPGEIVIQCGAFKSPMTNADRIRAMSDEELALELALIAAWDRKEVVKAKNGPGLVKFMLEWLRKSEEVDGTWID